MSWTADIVMYETGNLHARCRRQRVIFPQLGGNNFQVTDNDSLYLFCYTS